MLSTKEEGIAELEVAAQQDHSQDSGESFEIVDSKGLEKEMGNTKKKGKEGKEMNQKRLAW